MTSLRIATTTALAAALSALAVFGGLSAYVSTRQESNEFLDLQQRQISRYVGDLTFIAPGEAALPLHEAEDDYVVEVTYKDGRAARNSGSATVIPDRAITGFSEFEDNVGRWRVFSLVTPERTVQVAQQLVVREELATDAAFRAILPFVLSVPLSWLVVTLVVGRIFRRLESLATNIGHRELIDNSPIDISMVPREMLPFVLSFNQLLARQQMVMERQRNFLSDAAHELRTPLAALAIQIGNLGRYAQGEDFNNRLRELEAGARRVTAMAGQLLKIARYESIDTRGDEACIRLDELAKEVVVSLLPLADERAIDLGFSVLHPIVVWASCADLRTLIEILVDNAVRYTPTGGKADLAVTHIDNKAILTITDNGAGVSEELLPRLTERFFRGATGQTEGSGLGLAIAETIAIRHKIGLQLANRKSQTGFCAEIVFDRWNHGS